MIVKVLGKEYPDAEAFRTGITRKTFLTEIYRYAQMRIELPHIARPTNQEVWAAVVELYTKLPDEEHYPRPEWMNAPEPVRMAHVVGISVEEAERFVAEFDKKMKDAPPPPRAAEMTEPEPLSDDEQEDDDVKLWEYYLDTLDKGEFDWQHPEDLGELLGWTERRTRRALDILLEAGAVMLESEYYAAIGFEGQEYEPSPGSDPRAPSGPPAWWPAPVRVYDEAS